MRWYADNSDLNSSRGAEIPDLLLFGGILVSPEVERDLRKSVEEIKAHHAHPRVPIKWNFKDLRSMYEKQGMAEMYEKMLAESKVWRSEIFENITQYDFKIILACVQSHSIERKKIKGKKLDLVRYVFSNGLMRVALHAKEIEAKQMQVILDWPEGGDPYPFNSEYSAAYNNGTTREGNVSYHSGPLKDLEFMDSAVYANMKHSTLLQFADLVVGACRECIEVAIGGKESGLGVEVTKMISDKFRGYPENIYGKGISVASGDTKFRNNVKTFIEKELQ